MQLSWARRLAVSAAILLSVQLASQAQTSYLPHIAGPSFTCPRPRDALAQLVCDSPALARFDLSFAETYQALRQQLGQQFGSESQAVLRQESIEFDHAVRQNCGIATPQSASGPPPPLPPPYAAGCALEAYQRQQWQWQSRLIGPAAEEVALPIERRVGLQTTLQQMDLLTTTDPLTGVFGPLTRAAIAQWQTSTGRAETGILGAADARDLPRAFSDFLIAKQVQNKLENDRLLAEQKAARRGALVAKYGDHADAILAGIAQIGMRAEEVVEAKGDPRQRVTIPPTFEIWVYDDTRVAFTDGKVTHVGQ